MAQKNDIVIGATPLERLVNQVELELGSMLKSEVDAEAAKLAKARPGEETPGEASASPDASASDPTGDNTSVASASPDASMPAPDASASPDASAAPPAGPDASASPDGAPADPAAPQGPIDPQALAAEYAKLPPEDLKAHYYAIKEVMFQAASAAGADPTASAAPAPDVSAAPAAPAGGPPAPDASAPTIKAEIGMKEDTKANGENPLGKSELTRAEVRAQLKEKIGTKLSKSDTDAIINYDLGRVGIEGVAHMLTGVAPLGKTEPKAPAATVKATPLNKSENDVLKEELAKTNAALATLVKAVKVAVESPLRKSVQFAADLKIPGDGRAPAGASAPASMPRDQVRAQLKEKATDMKLTKSDRQAIIDYDLGRVTVDKVQHLLK